MRWGVLLLPLALAAGCGKKDTGPTKPAPSDAAFAENSPDNTLAWLAAQQNALDAAADKDSAEKFKALAESMKGRTLTWPGTLSHTTLDKTYCLTAYSLHTDPPEPKGEEKRERHYALICKPFEPGVALLDDAPFVRKLKVGFPSGPGWPDNAKAGKALQITGTIAAVQVHRHSWVTGYGIKDRVVHTEVGVTLHLTDGVITAAR